MRTTSDEQVEFVKSFFSREEAQQLADELNKQEQTDCYFVEID
jgi:hypothetical protein